MNLAICNLDEHVVRMLVRFFRNGSNVAIGTGDFRLQDDLEYLRIQWAISPQIEDLVRYLLENRHEAQASLETVLRESTGIIRGRLDTVRTIQQRRMTGDMSRVCYLEPKRTFSEGPNHVLAWVLRFSEHILRRYLKLLEGSDAYNARAHQILSHLGSVLHLKGIGDTISNTNIRQRPSITSIIQAGKTRKRLYRKAFSAYQALQRIEAGDQQEAISLLNGSLVGPLEDWQKFELLLALKMAEALANATKNDLVLRPIEPGSPYPIAVVGPFDVYWQNPGPHRAFVDAEPSESIVNEILMSYGVRIRYDRPDIVICDRNRKEVAAIAEAKFSTSADPNNDTFRDAISQLVRYSRMYVNNVPQDALLKRSLVAISNLPEAIRIIPPPSNSPLAYCLDDLINTALDEWVKRVTFSYPSSTL